MMDVFHVHQNSVIGNMVANSGVVASDPTMEISKHNKQREELIIPSRLNYNSKEFVPPSWDRDQRRSDDSFPFCFTIHSVENLPQSTLTAEKFNRNVTAYGLTSPDGLLRPAPMYSSGLERYLIYIFCHQKTADLFECESRTFFHLQAYLFDSQFKQFFGRMWIGPKICFAQNTSQKLTVTFEHDVYFHIPYCDVSIYLVMELIQSTKTNQRSVSWTMNRLFKISEKGVMAAASSNTLQLYYGTPRALLLIDTFVESSQWLQKVQGSQVLISLLMHKPLLKIIHLIPESTLIGDSDIICGLKNPLDDSSILKGMRKLKKIPLRPCTSCEFQQVVVQFNTTLEKFESAMCLLLAQENVSDVGKASMEPIKIIERRLQVGIHNSWDYIEEPHTYHLVPGGEPGLRRTLSGDRRRWGSFTKKCQLLILRNKIQLDKIPIDSEINIVFIVEFIVVMPAEAIDSKAPNISRTVNVTVHWATWKPFPEAHKFPVAEVVIPLMQSSQRQISETLVYGGNGHEDKITGEGKIKFACNFGKKVSSKPKSSMQLHKMASSRSDSMDDEQTTNTQKENVIVQDYILSKDIVINSPSSTERDLPKDLGELPLVFGSWTRVVSAPPTSNYQSFSRALQSRFHNSEDFPPFLSRWDHPATIVNPRHEVEVDFSAEEGDSLQTNNVFVHLVAFSWSSSLPPPKSIIVTFQFYRFQPSSSGRFFLTPDTTSIDNFPYILRAAGSDGTIVEENPGFQMKYIVDPGRWPPDSHKELVFYLANCHFHLNLWDGDSLFYLGQCTTGLKHLCRRGRDAVQALYEMDVVNWYEKCNSQSPPANVQLSEIRGRLYARFCNIGQPAEPSFASNDNQQPKSQLPPPHPSSVDVDWNNVGGQGNESRVTRARSLRELNNGNGSAELADRERERKLKRMNLVRSTLPEQESALLEDPSATKLHQLRLVQATREKNKHRTILRLLQESVATEHSLHVSLGEAAFFEFSLVNPFNEAVTVTVHFEDTHLKVITSPTEWQHLKELYRSPTPVEQNFASVDRQLVQIFLHANECVPVPFKYQTFHWIFSDQNKQFIQSSQTQLSSPAQTQKLIKVSFRTQSSVIAVLLLTIQIVHPLIHHRFRFHQEAETIFQRCIRVPSINISPSDFTAGNVTKRVYTRCSGMGRIHCEAAAEDATGGANVIIKVACGASGSCEQFFVFVYTDPFLVKTAQVWHVTVTAVFKRDVSCSFGQTHNCQLSINGSSSARIVRCYISSVESVITSPVGEFVLAANGAQNINLRVKPTTIGLRQTFLNVVDVEAPTVVQCWFVCINCQPPDIARTFKVDLQLGSSKSTIKKVTFTNPYSTSTTFHLHSTHPQILQLRDPQITLSPHHKGTIGLIFPSMHKAGPQEVLLFIDNTKGKNEEVVAIQITYIYY